MPYISENPRSLRRFRREGQNLVKRTAGNGIRKDGRSLKTRPPETDPAKDLRKKLLSMYLAGTLTAVMLVEMSVLITKAGGKGLERLARDLDHSKNAFRVVNKFLGTDLIKSECLMSFTIPQNVKEILAARLPLEMIIEPSAISASPALPL